MFILPWKRTVLSIHSPFPAQISMKWRREDISCPSRLHCEGSLSKVDSLCLLLLCSTRYRRVPKPLCNARQKPLLTRVMHSKLLRNHSAMLEERNRAKKRRTALLSEGWEASESWWPCPTCPLLSTAAVYLHGKSVPKRPASPSSLRSQAGKTI